MTTQTVAGLEGLIGALGAKIPIPSYPDADILVRPLDIGRSYLAELLCSIIQGDTSNVFGSIQSPSNIDNGDLVVILPKLSHGSDPDEFGRLIMQKFQCPLFLLPIPDGVHLRVMFTSRSLPRLFLPYVNDRKEMYGRDVTLGLRSPTEPASGRKRVVVEFSSPNIAGEFQGKHLRSTILGNSIAKMHEYMGWDVVKLNYLGDWGKPMGLLGAGWERFGSEELFEADPVGHLLDVYHRTHELFVPEQKASKEARDAQQDPAKIESQGLFAERNAFFKRMEEHDEKALALWKRLRDISIESCTELYSRMGITFDDYSGESQVGQDTMAEVEGILKTKEIGEAAGSGWVIDLKRHSKKLGTGIIRDRAGSSTYLLRDLAAALERLRKYSFDQMIYVVAGDHTAHFQRVVKILELMGMSDLAGNLQHVPFSETSHMAERLGIEHPTLGAILDSCKRGIENVLDKNQEKMAVIGGTGDVAASMSTTALLTQELSCRKANEQPFDLALMTSFEIGTGLDLSYWAARLHNLSKADANSAEFSDGDFASFVQKPEDIDLLRLLLHYPEVTQVALKSLEPATVMAYIISVVRHVQFCFEEDDVDAVPTALQRSLYMATSTVLKLGMQFLGINPIVPG